MKRSIHYNLLDKFVQSSRIKLHNQLKNELNIANIQSRF
jgi:hypothetical protein